jgi:ribosome-binding factor A
MSTRRLEQVGDLLRAELSDLLRREMQDPRLGFVTITNVAVSADLRNARVSVSCYGDEAAQQESLRALRGAAGFLRSEVGKRVRLRTIPQFTFHLDRSMAHAEEVQRTLHALAPELAASAARDASAQADAEGAEGTEGSVAGRRGN